MIFSYSNMTVADEHERRILQVHQYDIGVSGLETFHGISDHFLHVAGNAAPHRIIAPELPHHQVGLVVQYVALEAANIAGNVIHDASAVDQLDSR